jgi:hypothetical protein
MRPRFGIGAAVAGGGLNVLLAIVKHPPHLLYFVGWGLIGAGVLVCCWESARRLRSEAAGNGLLRKIPVETTIEGAAVSDEQEPLPSIGAMSFNQSGGVTAQNYNYHAGPPAPGVRGQGEPPIKKNEPTQQGDYLTQWKVYVDAPGSQGARLHVEARAPSVKSLRLSPLDSPDTFIKTEVYAIDGVAGCKLPNVRGTVLISVITAEPEDDIPLGGKCE